MSPDFELACSVYDAGLSQLIRNLHEILSHQEGSGDRDEAWQDECQVALDSKRVEDCKFRNECHLARYHHCAQIEKEEQIPAFKLQLCECVSVKRACKDASGKVDERDLERIEVGEAEMVIPYRPVSYVPDLHVVVRIKVVRYPVNGKGHDVKSSLH